MRHATAPYARFATRPPWIAWILLQLVLFALPYLTMPAVQALPERPTVVEVLPPGGTSVTRSPSGPVPHMAGRIFWYADFSPVCVHMVFVSALLNALPVVAAKIAFAPFEAGFHEFRTGILLANAYAAVVLVLVVSQWALLVPWLWVQIRRPAKRQHTPSKPTPPPA